MDYAERHIRFHAVVERDAWRLKAYHLLHGQKQPDGALMGAALDEAFAWLPGPDDGPVHYGVGFVGVHQGASFDFVLVAYWAYETELRFQTWMRPTSQSYRLEPVRAGELSADVWDLALLAHERRAWVERVLRPAGGDLEAYLEDSITSIL